MAQKMIDLCDFPDGESHQETPADGSVVVVINGVYYSGEFCEEHRESIRALVIDGLGMHVVNNQPGNSKYRRYVTKSGKVFTALDARHWLISHGYDVPQGGRLSAELIERYQDAN